MKKKILLTVFAVILVLATALTCTACNKKELKLKNDMSADELMVALVKADVKSITKVETTSNGMVSTTYFTQSGSTEIIERDGKVQRAEFKSFEDGKYFNFTKRDADSEWIKGAYTLGGNEVLKSSVDEFRSEFTDLLLNISVGKTSAWKTTTASLSKRRTEQSFTKTSTKRRFTSPLKSPITSRPL